MADIIPWIATAATIVAAFMTAANLGSRITGLGFAVFLIGSLAWLAHGLIAGESALVWTNAVLTLLNIFGIWRWLGRQAQVEKGASRAAERSERLPVDTLFPASLFTTGRVFDASGKAMANCIDAMVDCHSGRPAYLVVSQGGIAGAGETLRRLPWSEVSPQVDGFHTSLGEPALGSFDPIDRDQWPAR